MKIGKTTQVQSAICTSNEDSITVRGADLCRDLIGHIGFSDYFHLLLTGERPSPAASRVLEATLVAITEHGLVPSVQAARMTLAAAPDAKSDEYMAAPAIWVTPVMTPVASVEMIFGTRPS